MIKIEIKSIFGSVLFSYEKEGNTIKETLEKAIKDGANLYGANLYGANLTRANLDGANLTRANLYGANLDGANLPIYCKWGVTYRENGIIKIGCKEKTIEDWETWFASDETFDTKRDTEDFARIYASYVAVREYVKLIVLKEKK